VRLVAAAGGLAPGERLIALPDRACVSQALEALGLGEGPEVVAMLDGGPAWPDTLLRDGAVLELMPIVDGG